jgi:hypothetical protein
VAERERLTNRERRERAREERKRKEAEAAKKTKRNQLRNGLVTFAIVGVIAAVVLQAFLGGPDTIDDTILVASSEAEDAREAAGCEVLADRDPLPDRQHFPNNATPDPDTIYGEIRPTHSGPHTEGVHPVTASANRQIDEVSTTHNLEHGTIIVWYDPAETDAGSEIGTWAETLNANGFRRDIGGIGIITSPYEEPGISSGKGVALRAWGTAWDCDEWDETVANAFVIENYGTHGIGPERSAAPYPNEVLAYEDVDVDDTSTEEAPIDGSTPSEEVEILDDTSDDDGADVDGGPVIDGEDADADGDAGDDDTDGDD